ncbi:branched-chain amino acid ABC transporter permease [Pseudonocardia parietis]|uniref:Branched-chain amino acid transport system permease protein n=1 Tax=Pseudonocardia parietis TaxID=570936 RepID=A0ABS4W156_9PSEU|nr:branched-chain amino acid ABC transporter permease [Pseudonocardia parietis]MBP2369399.1 branched-chain amino acid transport system permease protein [Pseudonocardia parietis]
MLQSILSGLEAGSWYSLLGMAIVVVMKAADVPNFAMAEIGLLATYVGHMFNGSGLSFWVAVVVTIVAGVLAAVLVDLLLMRRLAGHGHFPMLLMTIGLGLALSALISLVWGQTSKEFRAPWSESYLVVAGSALSVAQLVTIGVGALAAVVLSAFFASPLGAGMRAAAENRATARLVGVRVGRLSALAWGIGGGIAAIAIMLQAQSTLVSTTSAHFLIVYAFVAATMGGFTSLWGTFAGGLVLGVLTNLAGLYISTSAQAAVALLAVVVVLLLRPTGFATGMRLRHV